MQPAVIKTVCMSQYFSMTLQIPRSCTWLLGCACWNCTRRDTQTSMRALTLPTPAWRWSSSFPCWEWYVCRHMHHSIAKTWVLRYANICDAFRCLGKEIQHSGLCSQWCTFWPLSSSAHSSIIWADGGLVRWIKYGFSYFLCSVRKLL